MNRFKFGLVLLSFLAVLDSSYADNFKCSSTAESLQKSKGDFQVQLNADPENLKAGLYKHKIPGKGSTEGLFICEKPNEKGIAFCKTNFSSEVIQQIVVHPVMGLMIRINDQDAPVHFSCRNVSAAKEICGQLTVEATRYDGNKTIFRSSSGNENMEVFVISQNVQIDSLINSIKLNQQKSICVKGFISDLIKFDSPRDFYIYEYKEN